MPVPSTPRIESPTNLRERVYEQILGAIIDGTLEPGEPLPDEQMTTWLGVSRAPLREALARLAEAGVVELPMHRTARVSPIDVRQINQALGAVAPLLTYAIRVAFERIDQPMLTKLDRHADAAVKAAANGDRRRQDLANREFYGVFVEATENPVLYRSVVDLIGVTARALTPREGLIDTGEIAARVSDIRDSFRARDLAAALRAHEALNTPTYENFLTKFRSRPTV